MVVGLLTVELHVPGSRSLKEKRMVLRRIKDRLKKFNVAVSDGLLSASTTLTVNITGANDAPTITAEVAVPTLVDTAVLDSFGPVTGQLDGHDVDAGASLSYQIVGQTEADAKGGRISYNSPLGRALIGRKVDDEVEVTVPSGDRYYVVSKIEFI